MARRRRPPAARTPEARPTQAWLGEAPEIAEPAISAWTPPRCDWTLAALLDAGAVWRCEDCHQRMLVVAGLGETLLR